MDKCNLNQLNVDKLKELWATKKKQILVVAGVFVVLCLLLSTCGNKGGKYDQLIALLEKGEYQSAHYYIDSLQRKEQEENKKDDKKESQIAKLYGEWTVCSNYGNEDAFETVSFDKDGTCKIGKDSFKWRMTDEQDTYINVDVTEGEAKRYRVGLTLGNKEISLSLSEYEGENGMTNSIGDYRNLDFYEAVEITAENWDKYFEFVDEGKFGENEFGEVTSFQYYQYLSLKEEYIDKFSNSLSKLVMELDFTYGKKGCQVDLESKKYTLTDSYEVDTYDRDSSIYSFNYSNYEDVSYYRTTLMSPYFNKENSYLSDFKTDMEIIRVQGTIYLLK